MRKTLFIKLFIFICCISNAQSFKDDVLKIGQSYDSYKKISMNIIYKVYKNKALNQPTDINYGFYQKNNEAYRNKLDRIESLVTKDMTIYVDTVGKTMICSKSTPQQNMAAFDVTKIDEMAINYKKVEAISSVAKGTKAYRIWMGDKVDQEIEYYEIYFDSKTFIVKQMNLIYNKQVNFGEDNKKEISSPKVEICFNNIDVNPKFSKDQFSTESYLHVSGKSYKPVGRFKNYKVNVL